MGKELYEAKNYVRASALNAIGRTFRTQKAYPNGGEVSIMAGVDTTKSDYKPILTIARQFASEGKKAQVLAPVHARSSVYDEVYGSLRGTKYENKCPDLKIGEHFYEFEGFVRPWNKRKVSNMLAHGLAQSDRIIIDNGSGASDRYIKKAINARRRLPNAQISEVWLYVKGKVRLFYKDGVFK